MKCLFAPAFAAALIGLSNYSYAAGNGVNYDPAHSALYVKGQNNPDANMGLQEMTNAITADLSQIKNVLNFNVIKTYYSAYCHILTGRCVPSIAQFANAVGLKVLLGVYEFPLEPTWTEAQVKAAIAAANNPTYGNAVIGIVVGNEDMFDYKGVPNRNMQRRIVADIKKIMAQVSVPVTTAQRQGDWCGGAAPGCDPKRATPYNPSLNQDDPEGVLSTIQVIGANIFPYWGDSPEQIDGVSVASKTQNTAMELQTQLNKNVIVTEEGWPSCFNPGQNSAATIANEMDYFTTWSMHQNQIFDSYYFMAYDLAAATECGTGGPLGDANLHFGLYTNSGVNKLTSPD
jgi:exo-beta-1,3-glucanase (GH17 family)